jgi:hypothetical protein
VSPNYSLSYYLHLLGSLNAFATNIIGKVYTTGIICIGHTTFTIIQSTLPILYQPTHLVAEAYECQNFAK